MKTPLKVSLVLLAGLVFAIAALALFIQLSGIPKYDTERIDLKVEATAARMARGKRTSDMLCSGCHLDPKTKVLSGKRMEDAPPEFGVIYSKNITQHPVTGIGTWTDGEIATLLRTGIRRDGQYAPPWMPKLVHMADEDLYDLIAFLRSDDPQVRPSDVPDREPEPSFLTKVLCRVVWKPFPYPKERLLAPDPADKVADGKYLVTGKLDCYPCHSADFKTVDYFEPEKSAGFLGGGNAMRDLGGKVVYTTNITFDRETGIGSWSEEQFRRALKGGFRPDNSPLRYPMQPYPELSDEEAAAIYAYLKTVPPLRNPRKISESYTVAGSASKGKEVYYKYSCNTCHGDTGVGLYDLRQGPRKYLTNTELVAFIRNPEKAVPGTKMPTWDEVIAEDEYEPLAEYVRSLAAASPTGAR